MILSSVITLARRGLLSAIILILCQPPCFANTPQCILLIVPGLNISDFTASESGSLRSMVNDGSAGWMVCKSALKQNIPTLDSYPLRAAFAEALTCGNGARSTFPEIIKSDSSAFVRKNKMDEMPLDITAIQKANSSLDHQVVVGHLGNILHLARLKTAVLGDNQKSCQRARLTVMDSTGLVDCINPIGEMLVNDKNFPYGIRSDLDKYFQAIDSLRNTAALVAVEYDGLERSINYSPYCLPAISAYHISRARLEMNRLIEYLSSYIKSRQNSRLIIIGSPKSAEVNLENDRLKPVIVFDSSPRSGTIYSLSTRRRNFLLDIDLLPSIIDFLHLQSSIAPYGRAIRISASSSSENSLSRFVRLNRETIHNAELQNKLGGLPTVQMLLVLAGVAVVYLRKKMKWLRFLALCGVSLPFGMLVLPRFVHSTTLTSSILLVLFTALISFLGADDSESGKRSRTIFESICCATLIIILADLLTGSNFLKQAWMSYSLLEGARFYGIGNEYMGAVLGAGCVLIASVLSSKIGYANRVSSSDHDARTRNRQLTLLIGLTAVLGAMILVMGAPQFGAKVGAVPTCVLGWGAALAYGSGKLISRRKTAFITLCMVLLIVCIFSLNLLLELRPSTAGQSHFIRAVTGKGVENLWNIAKRKLFLEGRLLISSPWSLTMAVSAAAFWLTSRKAILSGWKSKLNGNAAAGFWISAAASLLFNDSGVTAAALIMIFAWAWAALNLQQSVV